MTAERQCSWRPRLVAGAVTAMVAALPLAGCAEVESAAVDGYHPSKVSEVPGSEVKRVVITDEGARRSGLRTAAVRARGDHRLIPYESLVYDGQGTPWVYAAQKNKKLTFMRDRVTVDRVDGDWVVVTDGPRPGTHVATVGASLLYGTELGIEGGH